MLGWLDEVAGPGYSQVVLWTLLALLLLVVLLIIIKLIRSMTFGTFVAGGRNRKTRLASDGRHSRRQPQAAGAGAPRRCRAPASDRRTDRRGGGERHQDRPSPPHTCAKRAGAEQHAPPPLPSRNRCRYLRPSRNTKRAPEPTRSLPQPAVVQTGGGRAGAAGAPHRARPQLRPLPRPELQRAAPLPVSPPVPRPAPRPDAAMPAAPVLKGPAPTPPSDDLDDALLKELEVSLDDSDAASHKVPTPSLDDEMAKLLGELSKPRR